MSLRGRGRRSWLLLGVAPTMVLAVSCASLVDPRSASQVGILPDPPPAVAPPDPGVEPPRVRLLEPGGPPVPVRERPQSQLVAWSESMSDELNIPRAALQAYGYTARYLEATAPDCGLSWTVLAGIGSVESSHGRYGGAGLDGTGRPSKPIRGLPLDGREGVKRVEDTDGGELDGDEVFDRAVGPLQFIPATWAKWSIDADVDGVADPDDIDDAALAAGGYLCAEGGNLRDSDGFWTALLAYNQSEQYAQDVLDRADQYGRRSQLLRDER